MMSQADFTFAFKDPVHLPNPMVAIQGGDFGYHIDDQATIILDKVSRSVLSGQRIGILGANGQGKSTFVKTLAQAIPLLSGEITQGKGLSIGYFAQQELDVLELKQSPLEHMIELAKKGPIPGREQEIRNFLGTFKFADQMVNQAVGTLSGGEKARLVLAMIVWQRPNLLLLDEPTNHLDLMTREALGMAINDFEGTVLLVSHDRALLRSVCEEFWLVSRSGITDFKGDMDEYQKYLLEESKKLRDTQTPSSASSQAAPAVNMKGLSRQEKKLESQKKSSQQVHHQTLKKELQAIESNIQHLEVQKHALLEKMAQASIPQGASAEQTASRDVGMEMAKSGKALRQVEQSLNELEEKWLEVSQALEGQGLLASPNA
jgi:ATP-binding cassette subfamily F protein 3